MNGLMFSEFYESTIADFSAIRNNFIISCGFYDLAKDSNFNFSINNSEYVKLMVSNFNDSIGKNLLLESFRKSSLRSTCIEAFEIVKKYASETDNTVLLMNETWYYFARIIRNSLSHKLLIEFTKDDKKHLPIIWNHKEISILMNGQFLSLNLFSYKDCLILLDEIKLSIEKIKKETEK